MLMGVIVTRYYRRLAVSEEQLFTKRAMSDPVGSYSLIGVRKLSIS